MATSEKIPEEELVYDPLPATSSIRLLRCLGKTSNGILSFALDTVDLRNQPQYHCLSYTWGNPHANGTPFREEFERVADEYSTTNLVPICVNGKTLKIRQNLYEALCQLPTEGWVSRILNRKHPETMCTKLHDSAKDGKQAVVRNQILAGADIHARDRLGRSPLHYAALNGHLETAKVLVKAGAEIEAVDNEQKTAKDLALEHDQLNMSDLLTTFIRGSGKTLLEAVADLNEPGPDDLIWIDAVCIDQTNLEERSTQVGIMDSIYFNARYTVAWLGRKDRFTDAAFDTVAKLLKSGNALVQSDIVPYRTYLPQDYHQAGLPYISQRDWDALASLFLRQWFRRVWVFQEVIFATAIILYCGDREIQWDELGWVMALLQARYIDIGHPSSSFYIPIDETATSVEYFLEILYSFRDARFKLEDSQRQKLEQKSAQDTAEKNLTDGWSLINLIMASFPFRATDPRDKIFALYALSRFHPDTRLQVQPNYKEPVEELYSNVTKAIIESRIDLEVLSSVQRASSKKIVRLPSWVPDYSLQGTGPLRSSRFMACGSLVLTFGAQFYFSPWNELVLRGVTIDLIDRTANPRILGDAYGKFKLDPSWFDLIISMDTINPYQQTGQPISEVLWRTLCADTVSPQYQTTAPPECGAMFKTLVCAMVCAGPEHQARAMTGDRENAIQLGGLLASAARLAGFNDECVDSMGPDEDQMVRLRRGLDVQDTSLRSPIFDSVRSTILKLDRLAASQGGTHIPTSQEIEAYFKRRTDPVTSPGGVFRIPSEVDQFAIAHNATYGGRRLFATRKGYLGLGPASLEVGDTVWILPGAKVPFILRHAAGAAGNVAIEEMPRYKLVGEAYVHGIMKGEAVDTPHGSVDLTEIKLI